MNMAVDSARQNQPVGCVNNLVGSSKVVPQGSNASIADADIAGENV
jgi:hypothetical protein